MGEYKLVPVEPTVEMLGAGKHALEAGCYASGIYADMLAASPDVQGEPVGWQRKDRPERMITKLSRRTVAEGEAGVEFIPLYTAPQPAEQPPFQLPDFATDPDDSDEVASLWDHGYKRGWNACLEAVAKAPHPAEQQPALDVSALVEALEYLMEKYPASRHLQDTCSAALAAHRKGGDTP